MHYRMFALLPKDEAETSQEARENVQSELENDTSFVGEGGRFNSPVADWFKIGGRWSGALQTVKDYHKKVIKAIGKKEGEMLYHRDINDKEKQKIMQEVWENLGGKGQTPYTRDNYNDIGYDDDAVLVDKEIYKTHLKQFEKTYDWGKATNSEYHVELIFLNYEYPAKLTAKEVVGKYWIVVVDYHS